MFCKVFPIRRQGNRPGALMLSEFDYTMPNEANVGSSIVEVM